MAPLLGTVVSTPNLLHLFMVVSVLLLAAVSLLLVQAGRNDLPNSTSYLPRLLQNYRKTLCPSSPSGLLQWGYQTLQLLIVTKAEIFKPRSPHELDTKLRHCLKS